LNGWNPNINPFCNSQQQQGQMDTSTTSTMKRSDATNSVDAAVAAFGSRQPSFDFETDPEAVARAANAVGSRRGRLTEFAPQDDLVHGDDESSIASSEDSSDEDPSDEDGETDEAGKVEEDAGKHPAKTVTGMHDADEFLTKLSPEQLGELVAGLDEDQIPKVLAWRTTINRQIRENNKQKKPLEEELKKHRTPRKAAKVKKQSQKEESPASSAAASANSAAASANSAAAENAAHDTNQEQKPQQEAKRAKKKRRRTRKEIISDLEQELQKHKVMDQIEDELEPYLQLHTALSQKRKILQECLDRLGYEPEKRKTKKEGSSTKRSKSTKTLTPEQMQRLLDNPVNLQLAQKAVEEASSSGSSSDSSE
jgi:hypothetical protein